MEQSEEAKANVEMFKIKKLIKALENARGNGTSMISLIIPPKDQISRISQKLVDEYGTASNIKSRVNRLSVLSAITSTMQKLKLYTKVPPNGLVIYCGTVLTEEGKERKVNIDIEPFKPINTSLYLCDNKFHTSALSELLESDMKFGFIVMDGNGTLFGTLCGNTREVLQKFSVELPKKHGRGGQSALRFSRLRTEKRHNYVRKVAEVAVQTFITNDKINVTGIVMAGSADFKTDLKTSDMFDQRLATKVVKTVDVSYGGESGFNQAIELSQDVLSSVKFIAEKKLLGEYFDEISMDTGKVSFGVNETIASMEAGAVEKIVVWENLDIVRYQLKNPVTQEDIVKLIPKDKEDNNASFLKVKDPEGNEGATIDLDVIDKMPLVEWLAHNYTDFGCSLEFVTDKSQEGSQFVKGFGGLGGFLRYRIEMAE